jgi:MATE family multidrug resistance protein
MTLSASLFALAPGHLAAVFTPDVGVVALATTLIPIAAAFQLFDGTQVVAFGVLRGAGDQVVPSIANLIGYWCVGLPLGAWLALRGGMGVHGLWVGLVVALALVAVLLVARERWTWQRGGFRVVS